MQPTPHAQFAPNPPRVDATGADLNLRPGNSPDSWFVDTLVVVPVQARTPLITVETSAVAIKMTGTSRSGRVSWAALVQRAAERPADAVRDLSTCAAERRKRIGMRHSRR